MTIQEEIRAKRLEILALQKSLTQKQAEERILQITLQEEKLNAEQSN